MRQRAIDTIFADKSTPRSITIGTGAMISSIQVPSTAKARNQFRFSELEAGFTQAHNQIKNTAHALALVIRYRPEIVGFNANGLMATGWQNLNGLLLGRTFERVEISPYKDTVLSFDEEAEEVVASKLLVRVQTDKGWRKIGIGVGDNGVRIDTGGLIRPQST